MLTLGVTRLLDEPVIVVLAAAAVKVVGVVGLEIAVPSTEAPVVTLVVRTVSLVSRALVESII